MGQEPWLFLSSGSRGRALFVNFLTLFVASIQKECKFQVNYSIKAYDKIL